MNLAPINLAIDAAYTAALANPQKVAATPINGDATQTIQTVVYQAPSGPGFRVIGRVNVGGATVIRVKNQGHDTASEKEWPADIEAEVAKQVSAAKVAKAGEIYATGRTATLAIFSQLPLGVQAQFDPVLTASDAAAKSGDIAKAKEIVATCVVPDALAAAQFSLVAALDAVLPRATALQAATTVDAIKAT